MEYVKDNRKKYPTEKQLEKLAHPQMQPQKYPDFEKRLQNSQRRLQIQRDQELSKIVLSKELQEREQKELEIALVISKELYDKEEFEKQKEIEFRSLKRVENLLCADRNLENKSIDNPIKSEIEFQKRSQKELEKQLQEGIQKQLLEYGLLQGQLEMQLKEQIRVQLQEHAKLQEQLKDQYENNFSEHIKFREQTRNHLIDQNDLKNRAKGHLDEQEKLRKRAEIYLIEQNQFNEQSKIHLEGYRQLQEELKQQTKDHLTYQNQLKKKTESQLEEQKQLHNELKKNTENQLKEQCQLHGELKKNIENQLEEQQKLKKKTENQLEDQQKLHVKLKKNIENQLEDQQKLRNELKKNTENQLEEQQKLHAELKKNIETQLEDQQKLHNELKKNTENQLKNKTEDQQKLCDDLKRQIQDNFVDQHQFRRQIEDHLDEQKQLISQLRCQIQDHALLIEIMRERSERYLQDQAQFQNQMRQQALNQLQEQIQLHEQIHNQLKDQISRRDIKSLPNILDFNSWDVSEFDDNGFKTGLNLVNKNFLSESGLREIIREKSIISDVSLYTISASFYNGLGDSSLEFAKGINQIIITTTRIMQKLVQLIDENDNYVIYEFLPETKADKLKMMFDMMITGFHTQLTDKSTVSGILDIDRVIEQFSKLLNDNSSNLKNHQIIDLRSLLDNLRDFEHKILNDRSLPLLAWQQLMMKYLTMINMIKLVLKDTYESSDDKQLLIANIFSHDLFDLSRQISGFFEMFHKIGLFLTILVDAINGETPDQLTDNIENGSKWWTDHLILLFDYHKALIFNDQNVVDKIKNKLSMMEIPPNLDHIFILYENLLMKKTLYETLNK